MKSRSLVAVALFIGALLFSAGNAQAQTEGRPCADEPTDQLIAYGDHIYPCEIGLVGDSDLFRFQGVMGEVVTIRVVDQAGGSSVPACLLELIRPAGTLVTSVANVTACEITTTLDAGGLFTLRVTESGNDTPMTYAVELDRLAPASPVAASINPGTTISGAAIDPKGDADLFIFNGVNGDTISLRLTDQAGGSSVPSCLLQLYRPDGTLVAAVSNVTICAIDTTLNQSGVFTARVTESGDDALMTYNLEYQCLVGSCPSFHNLTVGRAGSGNVLSSPPGINCGTDCSERYFAGTVVTLIPTPDQSWIFGGWTGSADCGDGIVTVTNATTCVATFLPTAAVPDDVAVDFGSPYGLWILKGGSTWQPLHGLSPVAMVTGDLDGNGLNDLVVDFGPGVGVYAWLNDATWTLLHPFSPSQMVTGDLDDNGHDDVVFVFPGYGVWRWHDGTWSNLHGLDATRLAVGNVDALAGDDLILDFPGYGLYIFTNNTTWTTLHGLHATALLTADLDGNGQDEIVVDFGAAYGLWVYRNNATWTELHGLSATRLAAGHIDTNAQADLVIDFGAGVGIWTFRNNTTWAALHGLSGEGLVLADCDATGRDEILIDFGPTLGLWQYANDSMWNQLHGLSPEDMVAKRFH